MILTHHHGNREKEKQEEERREKEEKGVAEEIREQEDKSTGPSIVGNPLATTTSKWKGGALVIVFLFLVCF